MQISLDFEQTMKWNVRILLYQLMFLILSINHSFLVNVLYQIHVVYYIYKKQPCKQACLLNAGADLDRFIRFAQTCQSFPKNFS